MYWLKDLHIIWTATIHGENATIIIHVSIISANCRYHLKKLIQEQPNILTHKNQIKTIMESANNIYLVSDGGQEYDSGSYGAIMTADQMEIAKTKGKTPDAPELHSSFRSEAYGILAALTLLRCIQDRWYIKFNDGHNFLVYCDNESLIKRITKHRRHKLTVKEYYLPDIDVEMQILHALQNFQENDIQITFYHIKGHQDRNTPIDKLSFAATLNIQADHLAAKARSRKDRN